MKKEGFTLIEIIMCLALLSVIGLISIISLKKGDNPGFNEHEKEVLETAIDITSEKLKSNHTLKQFIELNESEETEDIISYFCITKETLINEGLISEDNEILKKIADDEYIKVSQDSIGAYIYDHPVTEDDCFYLKSTINNNNIENTEPMKIDKLDEEENGYYLEQHLTSKESGDNAYEFKFDFKFNTGKLSDTSFKPNIYTVFVVDGSGSMSTSEFGKVRDASIELSKTLTKDNPRVCNSHNPCNYVSAISFDSNVDKNIDFKTTKLTSSDFYHGKGGTNYTKALNAAYNRIFSRPKENNRFFVVFLSDGVPGDSESTYTSAANNIKSFLKPSGSDVEYGKLITVGFATSLPKLSNISSRDCKGTGTNCYYQANSSDIGVVFENFFNVIQKEVMCSTYKKTKISINLTENFKFNDGNNAKIIEENLECNKEDLTSNLQTQSLINNALYDLTFIKPDEDSLNEGTHEFSVIDKLLIEFYDGSNNKLSEITLNESEFPKIELDINSISVIN